MPLVEASPAVIYSETSDGHVYDTGNVYGDASTMDLEDGVTDHYARGFVKFSLSGVSGTLSSARLCLYAMASSLDDAFGMASPLANPGLGECGVLHIDDYGNLDSGDFTASSIGNDPGVLISDAETPEVGYISIDVTVAMQDDIDHGRPYTTFMIKLSTDTDSDGKRDGWYFGVSEQSGTDRDPYIEYVLASPLSWTQVNDDGFGDSNNKLAEDWIEFGGNVYIGVDNDVSGVEVWRTSDGASWSQVGGDGFGNSDNRYFSQFAEFGSELYASIITKGPSEVVRIFKSSDGSGWSQTGSDGFGDANNEQAYIYSFGSYLITFTVNTATGTEIWTWDGSSWTQQMSDGIDGDVNNFLSFPIEEFGGYLYMTTINTVSGVEVWRSSDGSTWSQTNSDGFDGDAGNLYVSGMVEFNAFLYAVTSNDNGFELWRSSDGTSWSKVGDDGFGDSDNYQGRLIVFKEDLYLITYNAGPDTGVEVWRTSDGTSWSQTNDDGFGDPNNVRGYPIVGGDYLYVATHNEVTGIKVFRSGDGASWSQINENGFGDIDNKRAWVRFIFNNHLYLATLNEDTGVEVWRLDEPMLQPDFQVDASPDSLTIGRGGSQTSTVTITSLNGFSSPVELSYSWFGDAPSDVTIDLPGPVTPPPDGSGTSELQVSAGGTATLGIFTLRVIGTSGANTHSFDVSIEITEAATTTTTETTETTESTPTTTETSETATTPTPSVTPVVPGCIIATAAYGSELSDEVQFLRSFRDEKVMGTFAGSAFMKAFNAFYYSFSPTVAKFISESPALKSLTRILLYPLMGALHLSSTVFNTLSFTPEVAVVVAGFTASMLLGVLYLFPITALVLLASKRLGHPPRILGVRYWVLPGILGLTAILLGELASQAGLMMVGSCLFVTSTIGVSGMTLAAKALKLL